MLTSKHHLIRAAATGGASRTTITRCLASTTTNNTAKLFATDLYTLKVTGNEVGGFPLRHDASYRLNFTRMEGNERKPLSPWHDIPLYPPNRGYKGKSLIVNMVVEIPSFTTAKMEIATKEEFNPIKQDIKKDKIRFYPFESLVNYGALPQTWEDPDHVDPDTKLKGDNDPLDVIDLTLVPKRMGGLYQMKVVGVLGMIDEGEMDWKIVTIPTRVPDFENINSVADVEAAFPGRIAQIVKWFTLYKVPDGKPENTFAFDGKMQDVQFARKVIADCHQAWKKKDAMRAKGLWVPN